MMLLDEDHYILCGGLRAALERRQFSVQAILDRFHTIRKSMFNTITVEKVALARQYNDR